MLGTPSDILDGFKKNVTDQINVKLDTIGAAIDVETCAPNRDVNCAFFGRVTLRLTNLVHDGSNDWRLRNAESVRSYLCHVVAPGQLNRDIPSFLTYEEAATKAQVLDERWRWGLAGHAPD